MAKLSIITPCLNMSTYLERAVDSVMSQSHVDLEYLVVDGGSQDDTVKILRKLEKKYNHSGKFKWISEPDTGQTNAINKGFHLTSGAWFAWLNADDYYEKNALDYIQTVIKENSSIGVVYGNCITHGLNITENMPPKTIKYKDLFSGNLIFGPSAFFNRRAVESVGDFDENLDLWMDFDMFMRISKYYPMKYVNRLISHFTERPGQKSHKNYKRLVNESKYVINKNRYPLFDKYFKWKYL